MAAALAAAAVLAGPGFAGAEEAAAPPPGARVETVRIELVGGRLEFVAPKTIVEGDYLRVVNETRPSQVGPHTFSLVTKGSLPRTPRARQSCSAPRHICAAIAGWHGADGEGPPTVNPVRAGVEGWSTMGSPRKVGDSWFTGERPGGSFVQQVRVGPGAEGKTIYFMCAIHPWMQGRITVLPAPAG